MQLNAKTKIDDLLKQYPFLLDFLITLSPKFKNLKSPVIRKTMGKIATLETAAGIGGMDTDGLISALTAEIDRQTGSAEVSEDSVPVSQGEALTDPKERQEALKGIIRDLHDGEDMEMLKQRFESWSKEWKPRRSLPWSRASWTRGCPPRKSNASATYMWKYSKRP